MAHKLDIYWHAFIKKNDENTEVAKMPRNLLKDNLPGSGIAVN